MRRNFFPAISFDKIYFLLLIDYTNYSNYTNLVVYRIFIIIRVICVTSLISIMHIVQQVFFIIAASFAIWLFAKNIRQIRRNILLGKDENLTDNKPQRWKNLLLLAFGQKKMFRNPLVAVMHFVIYAGFIIINIEVLEIVLDGLLGTHRLFFGLTGDAYLYLINGFEFLALGVFTVCVLFLCRRNILKLRRFISHDLDGW